MMKIAVSSQPTFTPKRRYVSVGRYEGNVGADGNQICPRLSTIRMIPMVDAILSVSLTSASRRASRSRARPIPGPTTKRHTATVSGHGQPCWTLRK